MTTTYTFIEGSEASKEVPVGRIPFRFYKEVTVWSFVFTCDLRGCNNNQYIVKGLTVLEAVREARQHQCKPTPVSRQHTVSVGKLKTWAQHRRAPEWHLHFCQDLKCPPVLCTNLVEHTDPTCEHGEMTYGEPY